MIEGIICFIISNGVITIAFLRILFTQINGELLNGLKRVGSTELVTKYFVFVY